MMVSHVTPARRASLEEAGKRASSALIDAIQFELAAPRFPEEQRRRTQRHAGLRRLARNSVHTPRAVWNAACDAAEKSVARRTLLKDVTGSCHWMFALVSALFLTRHACRMLRGFMRLRMMKRADCARIRLKASPRGRGWHRCHGVRSRRAEQPTEDGCPNEVAAGGERQIAVSPRHLPSRRDAGRPLVRRRSRARRTPYPQSAFQVRRDIPVLRSLNSVRQAGLTQQLTMSHLYS